MIEISVLEVSTHLRCASTHRARLGSNCESQAFRTPRGHSCGRRVIEMQPDNVWKVGGQAGLCVVRAC
jgi:hypothetical protein